MNVKLVRQTNLKRFSCTSNKYPVYVCCKKNLDVTSRHQEIKPQLEKAIENATNICALVGTTIDCMVAWDEVDELTTAYHKRREIAKDGEKLEKFCEFFPEADECENSDV